MWTSLSALVVMLALAGSVPAQPFAFESTGFCGPNTVVRDFGLSKLPPVREVPESAKDFGYGAITMYEVASQVMPEPEPFGYRFLRQHNYTNAAERLNWTVAAQLWTINSRGKTFRKVDRARLFIGRLNADDRPYIEVEPPRSRRGFYRFDLQIRNRADKLLGSYSTYFKVVRPSWRPNLRVGQDRLEPGQQLLVRLENYGSEPIAFDGHFSVQRFENGRWTRVSGLTRRRWRERTSLLGPGRTSRCTSLSLPIDTPLGVYQISKQVRTGRFPDGEDSRLAAPFEVIGSSVGIEYQGE
jgi:hypothetical protein